MPITFLCVCNITYTAEDHQAGQHFQCPQCHQTVIIPAAPAPAPVPQAPGQLQPGGPSAVVEGTQGWAQGFLNGQVPAGPPQQPKQRSKGAQLLEELTSDSESAMDDMLLGRKSAPPQSPTAPPPQAPAPPVPQPFQQPVQQPAQQHMAPDEDSSPQLLPESDPDLPGNPMNQAFAEVENLLKSTEKKTSTRRRSTTASNGTSANGQTASKRRSTRSQSAETSRRRSTKSSNRRRSTQSAPADTNNSRRRRTTKTEEPEAEATNKHVIACHFCEEMISRKASECPYCGARQVKKGFWDGKEKQLALLKMAGGVLALLALVGVAMSMISGNGDDGGGRRRRPKKIVKNDNDEPKDKPEDKPKDDPKKEPKDKKPKDKKPKDKGPKDPLAKVRKDIKGLESASMPGDVLTQIKELAKNPKAREIAEFVIRVDKDSKLAGRCYRVLFEVLKGEERQKKLREAFSAPCIEAGLFAVEIIIKDDIANLKSLFKKGRTFKKAMKVNRAYARALLELDWPGPKLLPLMEIEGTTLDVRPRMAVLRITAGDISCFDEALRGFKVKNGRLRSLLNKALVKYSGKAEIFLENPDDDDQCNEVAEKWKDWFEKFRDFHTLLKRITLDPTIRSGNTADRLRLEKERRALIQGSILEFITSKKPGAIEALTTYAYVEPSAQTKEAREQLARLAEFVAKRSDARLINRWLDNINKDDRAGALQIAITALNVGEQNSVDSVLRGVDRGLYSMIELNKNMPDLSLGREQAVQDFESRVSEVPKRKQGDYLKVLASLGSRQLEESILKERKPYIQELVARLGSSRLEDQLVDIWKGEDENDIFKPAAAGKLLSEAGTTNVTRDAKKLLGKQETAVLASEILAKTGGPGDKSAFLKGLKMKNNVVNYNCLLALTAMGEPSTFSKIEKFYEKDPSDRLKTILRNFLFAQRISSRTLLKEVRAEGEGFQKTWRNWINNPKGNPPRLQRRWVYELGQIGSSGDFEILKTALEAAKSDKQKYTVLVAMTRLKSKEAASSIRGFLLPNRAFRGLAAMSLAVLKNKEYMSDIQIAITAASEYKEEDGVLYMALSILDKKMASQMVRAALDKEKSYLGEAVAGLVFALSREEDPEISRPYVKKFLISSDSRARAGVARGLLLAHLHKKGEVELDISENLRPLLFDEAFEVRLYALMALLAKNDKFATRAAYSILRENDVLLGRPRNDLWDVYFAGPEAGTNYRSWCFEMIKKKFYHRRHMSIGVYREILRKIRKLAQSN